MQNHDFTITIHMVSSLDGYIAKTDNSVAWFETKHPYQAGVELESAEAFFKKVDCFVMGANTYTHALELSKNYGWPYGEKPTIVITKQSLPKVNQHISFYNSDLPTLVNQQLKAIYKNVWVAGGAMLATAFIKHNLAHQIRVSILPILLGQGLLFFKPLAQEHQLQLLESKAYNNGMIELCYEILQ